MTRSVPQPRPSFRPLYEQIQDALFDAVAAVHIQWNDVADKWLSRIKSELRRYRRVYSTNYDLLVYWSMMHDDEVDEEEMATTYPMTVRRRR